MDILKNCKSYHAPEAACRKWLDPHSIYHEVHEEHEVILTGLNYTKSSCIQTPLRALRELRVKNSLLLEEAQRFDELSRVEYNLSHKIKNLF